MTTVAELLRRREEDDHPALLFEEERITWREFVRASAVRAGLLAKLRGPGPFHVGVLLENVPEYLFWIGGAALAGAALVGINPTRRGEELASDVRHTDCQLVVSDGRQATQLRGLDVGVPEDRILLVDGPGYRRMLEPFEGEALAGAPVSEADTLLLLFTSGSTGAPKAVICSQGRLAAIAESAAERFGIGREDVLYQSMPLFHGNAIMSNWAPALAAGATVALRRKFSASGFGPDVRRTGATYFNYVGRALSYVLAQPPTPEDAENRLRLGFGTEASARDIEQFRSRFGCPLVENYGSSEGAILILRVPGTPEAALGLPPEEPSFDVIIADPETGAECPRARFDEHGALVNAAEAIGEIVNRAGAPAFEGYYKNPEAEAERIHDGWFWSGDLGYRDEAGWFYFAGRGADWLRVDSENFATAPVERILARFPGVALAAVYPVPDPRTGDQVMAALQLESGVRFDPQAFAGFLDRQADLGSKWAPRFVRIVDEVPQTANHKINKRPLRAERWNAPAGVFWRAEPGGPYRPMTPADVEELHRAFEAHGRAQVLSAA